MSQERKFISDCSMQMMTFQQEYIISLFMHGVIEG